MTKSSNDKDPVRIADWIFCLHSKLETIVLCIIWDNWRKDTKYISSLKENYHAVLGTDAKQQ